MWPGADWTEIILHPCDYRHCLPKKCATGTVDGLALCCRPPAGHPSRAARRVHRVNVRHVSRAVPGHDHRTGNGVAHQAKVPDQISLEQLQVELSRGMVASVWAVAGSITSTWVASWMNSTPEGLGMACASRENVLLVWEFTVLETNTATPWSALVMMALRGRKTVVPLNMLSCCHCPTAWC